MLRLQTEKDYKQTILRNILIVNFEVDNYAVF